MEIVQHATARTSTFRLRDSFLEPYYQMGDPFRTLLARSTYLSKYSRGGEVWTDTIRRVVEGNVSLVGSHSEHEAEMLFHLFWTGQALPPGRGLWVGGIEGIPADARYNCWGVTLRSIDDWCWTMNQLMLGGGVGVGLGNIGRLGRVSGRPSRMAIWCRAEHPNFLDVKPNDKSFLNGQTPIYQAPDSRDGWVMSLRMVLQAAFEGSDLIVDVSEIRPRGEPIRTFGGTACGPGPLTTLLRSAWSIVRNAEGRELTSIECLDITNMIGFCVKSGNVRRSALIVIGEAHDQAFRDAKKDFEKVKSHRHTSNNSIAFHTEEQIANFDWHGMVEDNILYGEPGLLNLALIRKTDPGATIINPCGEIPLHDREACNLAEAFPAQFDGSASPDMIFRLLTRYCLRQRMTPLLDEESDEVRRRNMRLGVGLGGICDFEWTGPQLAGWFGACRSEADAYADELGVARPNAVTTTKPSGTISLLNSSSPGIHAPYAPYYIRRARLADNDPMAQALMEAGVKWEHDQYDNTGHTLVFEFPTKAVHTRITVQTETIADQFERQAQVQEWWADNSVSATLSFDVDTERHQTAELLKQYVPRFKSTALLAKSGHGYVQAPYEVIDEATFHSMSSKIRPDHQLARGGDVQIEECSTGVCPIR
jgi:ribonucleoside-triphosphate reductase